MSELLIPKVDKEDIKVPSVEPGTSALVLQRHERYQRDRQAENSGSLFEEDAQAAKERDLEFFNNLFEQEGDSETMVLFVSSDTQYNQKGRRSLETVQIAEDAAAETLESKGISPASRIINLSNEFRTKQTGPANQETQTHNIRPISHLVEPDIFDQPGYVDFLRDKYGKEDGPGMGISKKAWAVHEADLEKEVREEYGVEGVHDIVDRTKRSIAILKAYAEMFHRQNPNKRLLIWAGTHYDTISPLVKDAIGAPFSEYIPVDYGGGVIVRLTPTGEAFLEAQDQTIPLELGEKSLELGDATA